MCFGTGVNVVEKKRELDVGRNSTNASLVGLSLVGTRSIYGNVAALRFTCKLPRSD